MPWIANLAYVLLLIAAAPALVYKRLRYGKYRDGWLEKLWGALPEQIAGTHRVWLHAVSVGEVLQLEQVLRKLRSACPKSEFVITTTTATGLSVARERFPQDVVCYFPLDFSWSVRRAIRRIKPSLVVLVELELWPNFTQAVQQAGLPLALVNGRISEKSWRGYRRMRPLMRRLLDRFAVLAVQTETYRERLVDLGAPPDRVIVTGSVKFDGVETNRKNGATRRFAELFDVRPEDRVFVAGSTLEPEESIVLDAWLRVRARARNLRLILVPRHPERFDDVARLLEQRGIPCVRRSTLRDRLERSGETCPVVLVDTLGELKAVWGLADLAFVGGSLVPPRGGQSMIEPAAYGAALVFGFDTANFSDFTEELLGAEAASVVHDADELAACLEKRVHDPGGASAAGQRAQQLVLRHQGTVTRTLAALAPLLPNTLDRATKAA
jgi:3-deoxy-D-manno-octulosonic-acid transferase